MAAGSQPAASPEGTRARAGRAEEARRERVGIAIANPVFFGEHYIRPLDEHWNAPLPEVAREMLGFVMSVRRGVLMTPPEFLKTTMVSQVYPLWLTYRYAALGELGLLTGMLLSEEQDLAEGNLSVIAWHIEHNERLGRDFVSSSGHRLVEPDPDEDKWTDSEIIVRRPGVLKDPTWQAKGLNSQGIQGSRLRHLIGDDLITPASADSPAKQKKAKKLWDTQITTRVFEDGQAIIAGNFNHPRDLLSDLAGKRTYAVMRRPAMHVPGDKTRAPQDPRDRSAIMALPERWSRLRLLQELAEKPATFAAIYLLRAGAEGGGDLKAEWVTRISLADIKQLDRVYFVGVDPAPGAEVDPDPSFFSLTIGVRTMKHLDVVESFADRMEPTEQVELLAEKVAAYRDLGHVGGIGVAAIALDRYWKGAVLVGHPELRPLLHQHSIPGSKEERLALLGSYFRGGGGRPGWARCVETAWVNQTASADDLEQDESLAEQWTSFPNANHNDRLDSLDLLIREVLDSGSLRAPVISRGEGGEGSGSPTAGLMEMEM